MAIPTNPAPNEEWTNDTTGVTYKWDGERWFIVASFDESSLVSQSEFEVDQKRQDDITDSALVVQGSIQSEQSVQNDQINALETQLQLLAQTQAVGKWDYKRNISGSSPRPPSGATFYATHKDGADTVLLNWADARLLMVSKTDKDGNVFTFTAFQEGDKVEILAVDGSSLCVGTVVNQPSQEAYGNLIIGVERSQGGPSENKEYVLSVYRPGANGGDVDLDVLDQRYATSQYVDEGDQGVKDYVDEQISNIPEYEPAPVDDMMTLTGTQLLTSGSWRIQQANSTGGTYSYISIDTDELKLYHLKEPTASHHAATKKYMDDKVEVLTNSNIPTNNALQSQIDTLRSDVDETFTIVFEEITDVEDEIKKSLDTQDAIKSDLSRLTIENVEQNAKIADLTARLEALENDHSAALGNMNNNSY